MNPTRIRPLNDRPLKTGPVVYWMSRDQRVNHNWAMIRTTELAKEQNQPIIVVFNLLPNFLDASNKQFRFMLEGLHSVEGQLQEKHIPFSILQGDPIQTIPAFIDQINAGCLITDFSPLRIGRTWRAAVAKKISISFEEVDAHNIVPVWIASPKQEFGAYTLRPKIHRLLPEYLDEFPIIPKQILQVHTSIPTIDWSRIIPHADLYEWISSGSDHALKAFDEFKNTRLHQYHLVRNDPTYDGQSNLSPYLHFGQLSAQYIAMDLKKIPTNKNISAFLEEAIIRRELADNFCFYNDAYDSVNGFLNWAKQSLDAHRTDQREYIYSLEEFEIAKTHEPLWNAAQRQMVQTGKMHGYMRMYWAKKILEWTKTPEEAMNIAITLNDRYELDGRDPNGYTGIAWSIGGVHDRPWFERPIFGKIRYMNYNGAKKKFDVQTYIETWQNRQ